MGGKPSEIALVNTIIAGQSKGVVASEMTTVTLHATLWDGNQTNVVVNAGAVQTGTADLNFFGLAGFLADGYHISDNSKAIGVGLATEVGKDIDGQGRNQGGGPDLGADELPVPCTVVASNDLSVTYGSVQAAIDAVNPGA
ncbi:MAG: hypothetical protein HC802_23645 [Caldilineaceae bacterium]|nr:hypothetical protein [Caldilineaceae bacterium]